MSDSARSIDLSTTYLGMRLRSPIVASSSPLTGDPACWEALEAAGAGAIVLPSLFEEQIEREAFAIDLGRAFGGGLSAESSSYLPDIDDSDTGPARHLGLVERARERLSIPIIASLNGTSPGGWAHYARSLVSAGAHAIELNIYDVVVDPRARAEEVEQRYLELVEDVRAEVRVPVAVKLGPWFTSLAHFATALERTGVDGLVLFNRFYQPDIDLDTLGVTPRLQLSTSAESRLPLHWIGILRGLVTCSLAGTTGVHEGADALKLLLVGADVAMTASALLRRGPEQISAMLSWIREWMSERAYVSVDQLKGSVGRHNVADPEVFARANYYQVLHSPWG
jgi:dihydroorotate dehydrogenase (fumarate)